MKLVPPFSGEKKTTEARFFIFWVFCMPFVVAAGAVPLTFLMLIYGFLVTGLVTRLSSFIPLFEITPEQVANISTVLFTVLFKAVLMCVGSVGFYVLYLPFAGFSALLLWCLPTRMRIAWLLILPWLVAAALQIPLERNILFFQRGSEFTDAFLVVGYVNVMAIIGLYVIRKKQGKFSGESND